MFHYFAGSSIDDPELLPPHFARSSAYDWSSQNCRCRMIPKITLSPKTSTHSGSILLLPPASLIEHLHESCFCSPPPVSFSLSLLSTAFCAWMTAMKHSLIFTAIFQGTPNEKILPTFSLQYTAPHKCWQETATPSLTFYGELWTHTIPIKDEAFDSAESERVWRNLMTHNVASILAPHSQATRCTICP